MTPQEAADYIKQKFTLPKGATVAVRNDVLYIGTSTVCFTLRDQQIGTEEVIDPVVRDSLPVLAKAMEEVKAKQDAAIKAEADLKAKHLAAKARRQPFK